MPPMKKKPLSALASLMAAILFSAVVQLQALDHLVTVNDFGFTPPELTIDVGDTVIWRNVGVNSSYWIKIDLSVLDPDYVDWLLENEDDEYAHTFNNEGEFIYYDQFDPGNTVKITVVASGISIITLESPRIEAGQFLFDVTGLTVGRTNVLQVSTNLTSWTAISTNVATSTSITFTNATVLPNRFFQVFELP
jgi:plastocyanin